MDAREIYHRTGPAKSKPITFTGAGESVQVSEQRDRIVLIFCTGLVPVNIFHGHDTVSGNLVRQIAAQSIWELNATNHFSLVGEPWVIASTGAGTASYIEVYMPPADAGLNRRDVVEEYKQRLLKRRREKLKALLTEVQKTPCAAMLLETPIQFLIRREQQSTIGGGGGETGAEALDTASPDLVGD